MYEYEFVKNENQIKIIWYKDGIYLNESELTMLTEEQLLSSSYLSLEKSYPDIRPNSKRKDISKNNNNVTQESSNTIYSKIIKGILYEYKAYQNNISIFVEIYFLGKLIETREFISDYNYTLNNITYSGIDGAIKDTQNSIQTFGTFANNIAYPSDALSSGTSDSIKANTAQSVTSINKTLTRSSSLFNNVNDDELKKTKKNIEDKITSLQGIGLSSISQLPKTIWNNIIEPKLLTKRQIIKKIIMITNQSLPIPATEEDAQLIVYGKLYYKNNILYDNDNEDPNCVSQPGDYDYHKPIDENHPLWKEIEKKIEDIKNALTQFGIKLGEFTFLVPQTMQVISVSITSMVSSLIILPIGSGIPTAMTAVQNIITAIKQLQAKIEEFLPLIAIIENISLIIPKESQNIISTILNIFKLITNIISGITLILGLIDIIIKLIEKLKRKMKEIKLKVKAIAKPNEINLGEVSILSVEVSGGDYDYIYEWTDQFNNVISKDPNSGEDDGTREITPQIPNTTKFINGIINEYILKYTCKVTDQKGNGSSETDEVNIKIKRS